MATWGWMTVSFLGGLIIGFALPFLPRIIKHFKGN